MNRMAPHSRSLITGAPGAGVGLLGRLVGADLAPWYGLIWQRFAQTDDQLLAHMHGAWDLPPAMPSDWEKAVQLLPLRMRAADLIIQWEQHGGRIWCGVTPALTAPFWQLLLPQLQIVICLRNPLDVVRALRASRAASDRLGWQLWQSYYSRLALLPPATRIVTHFESYFYQPLAELTRVCERIGTTPQPGLAAQIDQRRRRHWSTSAELAASDAPDQVIELYLSLCAEAGPIYHQCLRTETSSELLAQPALGRSQRDYRAPVTVSMSELIARLRNELGERDDHGN